MGFSVLRLIWTNHDQVETIAYSQFLMALKRSPLDADQRWDRQFWQAGQEREVRLGDGVFPEAWPWLQSNNDGESAVSKGLIEVTCGGQRYAINPDQVRYISQDSEGTSFVSFGERHGLTLAMTYDELVVRLNEWMQHEPDISPAAFVAAQ